MFELSANKISPTAYDANPVPPFTGKTKPVGLIVVAVEAFPLNIPEKVGAIKVPVEGLYFKLELLTFIGRLPELPSTKVSGLNDGLVKSSVMETLAVLVASIALVAIPSKFPFKSPSKFFAIKVPLAGIYFKLTPFDRSG